MAPPAGEVRERGRRVTEHVAAEPPADDVFPFTQGKWAGKRLSDVEREADFRMLKWGFTVGAGRPGRGARGRNTKCNRYLKWAARVGEWARFRGYEA